MWACLLSHLAPTYEKKETKKDLYRDTMNCDSFVENWPYTLNLMELRLKNNCVNKFRGQRG